MKPINILLIGSGGREHTLAWKISQSELCDQLYIAPGNGGTRKHGINLDIPITAFEEIKQAVIKHKVSLIIVGPEEPLVKGISDFFQTDKAIKHVKVIGPGKN